MKSITSLKNLLITVAAIVLLTQNIISLNKERSLIETFDKSFLQESSENLFQTEELEYAVPSTNSTDPAVMSAEGWMKISSPEFRNPNKFPALEINGNKFHVKTDTRNFRINFIYDPKKKVKNFLKQILTFTLD